MPVVTFSGQGPLSRNACAEIAMSYGWTVWGRPIAGVDVLVVGEGASSQRIAAAKRLGITIMSYDRWSDAVATGEV